MNLNIILILYCCLSFAAPNQYRQFCFNATLDSLPLRDLRTIQGKPGKAGPAGQKGENGSIGGTGLKGLPGPKGELGSIGPLGLKGYKGSKGECSCDGETLPELKELLPRLKVSACGLGVKDGRIPNDNMEASSYFKTYFSYVGRLDVYDRGWRSKLDVLNEWIQIDIYTPARVTGVVTQGSYYGELWVTSFKIFYGNSTSSLQFIQQYDNNVIFQANTNHDDYKLNYFSHPVYALYVRLYPRTWHGGIYLRMELLGC